MKINGRKIHGANVEYVVLPRPDGDLVFKATAILDKDTFHKLCPDPEPPKKMLPGGKTVDDYSDSDYLESVAVKKKRSWSFTFLETYKYTEGLEWETVDLNSPDTWDNFEKELRDSGITEGELARLYNAMLSVNGLDQEKLDEARDRFLRTLSQAQEK
jgi:hypothetical protein